MQTTGPIGIATALLASAGIALAAAADTVQAETRAAGPAHADAAANAANAADAQCWALVPIFISNAETGAQAGALVIRFLNPGDTANKPSTFGFAARVSQKAQVEVNLFPEWYLKENLYHVAADLNYIRWPADYYGLGNGSDIPKDSADGYLAQGVNGDVTVERGLFRGLVGGLSAGPQALFKYEDIETKRTRGLLTDTVPGKRGGFTSGLGAVMTYDGRDAVYWARRGAFLRGKAAWYESAWGSDYEYASYTLEVRRFFPFSTTGALGLSATFQGMTGEVPFRDLPTADGDHALRGLIRGKYRDRDILSLQAEYKSYLPDWSWLSAPWVRNRLGYAVFAEAGQVAHGPGGFSWSGFRPDFGAGVRYAMNPSQRMNIRVDIGYVDGTIAPAINIKEAF